MQASTQKTEGAREIKSLYEKHWARMMQLCRRILKDSWEAEDTCQDAFIKALKGWSDFEGRAQATTWIATICLNECRTRLRMRKYQAQQMSAYFTDEGRFHLNPDTECFRLKHLLERERPKLSPGLRRILAMHLEQGLNHREIAESLKVSRVYVTRSIGRIRQLMGGRGKPRKGALSAPVAMAA